MPVPEAQSGALRIERIDDFEGLLRLETEWRSLFEASGLDLFCSWEWQVSWWSRLAGDRALWVMVARDGGGRARGIAPMSLGKARIGMIELRRLGFLADDRVGSDYLDVIAVDEWRVAVFRTLAAYLAEHAREWDLIEWTDMDARSDSALHLAAFLGPDYRADGRPEIDCPGQSLNGEHTFEEFLSRTRRASNYRRRRRWLENQPGFRVDICEGGPGLEQAREIFFRLHRKRWAEEGGSAGIPDDQVRAFHVEATRRLAERGHLIFYTLWVAGLSVASVYAMACGTTFYYYQAGMDPAWRSRSVGLALIGETFADAIRRGMQRYDFLRGNEPYKSDWVDERRQLVRWRLYPVHGRGKQACRIDAGLRAAKGWIKAWAN